MDGEFNATLWRGGKALLNQRVCRLLKFNGISKEFIFRLIQEKLKEIEVKTYAVTVKHISAKQILDIQIPVPPLSIQEEIVAEIDSYQKIIDGARQVVENYKPRIDIDPKWEIVKLGDVCEFSQGVQIDLDLQLKSIREGYEKFLRIENYTQNSNDFRFIPVKFGKNKYVNKEDVVVVRYGASAGYIGRGFDGVLANNLFKVDPIINKLDKAYLFYFLSSEPSQKYFKKSTAGGAMPALSFGVIKEMEIPVPPLITQHEIISKIEQDRKMVDSTKLLINVFEQKIKDRIAKVWRE